MTAASRPRSPSSSGSTDQERDGAGGDSPRRAGGAPGPAARTPGHGNSRVDRRRSPASDPFDERSRGAALGVSEARDHPRGRGWDRPPGPASRKCSSGKYSSRSPCTSSSGVGAIALTTCSGEGGGVSHGSSSRSRSSRASQPPPRRRLQQPVHPPHRPGVADVPAADRAHAHDGVGAVPAQRRLPQDGAAAHRQAERSPRRRAPSARAAATAASTSCSLGVAAGARAARRNGRDPGSPAPAPRRRGAASRPAAGTARGPPSW